MVLRDLQIMFDNGRAVFSTGEILSGRVRVYLDSPKRINAIYLECKGESRVRWSETRHETRHEARHHGRHTGNRTHNHTRTIHFTSSELYFSNKVYLAGYGSGETILPAGEHWYQFQFQIPLNLPSSFEAEYGYIRYTVKAVLDRPWRFNQDAKVAFTLISHLDLNTLPNVQVPLAAQKDKSICCLCCQSGPITVTAQIPVGGFVPGQDIAISADVENMSNVNISSVKCVLQQTITFIATYPHHKTRQVTRTVAQLSLGTIGAHGSNSWQKGLKVPPCAPTLLYNCSIIKMEYSLQIKVVPQGAHKNLTITFPVTIGTIPIMRYQQQVTPAFVSPTAPPVPQGNYELPPPSYDECVFGACNIREEEDSEHTLGKMEFVPRYPTYNI